MSEGDETSGTGKKHQYTGPTDVRLTPEGFHIDGYLDAARIVKLNTKSGSRIADLRLHQSDLMFCQRVLQLYGSHLSEPSNDLTYALWTCVLVKFYSCFSSSGSRFSLKSRKVYAGLPIALECFDFYKNIRDKHIVHDENNYNISITGLVLGHDGEVQDILSLAFQTRHHSREDGQNVYNMVDHALKYVIQQIESNISHAFSEANSMSRRDREALPQVKYDKTVAGDESKTRQV